MHKLLKRFQHYFERPECKSYSYKYFWRYCSLRPCCAGVIDAYKNMGNINIPIIVRLQGTNAEEAKKLIDESGLKVQSAILLSEAADLVKKAVA